MKSNNNMESKASTHSAVYRRLFSHRQLARGLVETCFGSSARDAIDWEGAETVAAHSVWGSNLTLRENEIVWKLPRTDGADLYLFLAIELQARRDLGPLLRTSEYIARFDRVQRDLRRVGSGAGPLPKMVPLVLYMGNGTWEAPTSWEEVTGRLEQWGGRSRMTIPTCAGKGAPHS